MLVLYVIIGNLITIFLILMLLYFIYRNKINNISEKIKDKITEIEYVINNIGTSTDKLEELLNKLYTTSEKE